MTIYSLGVLFFYLEPVCCSMSSSNCCFLTCIHISQEAGQVVWYSHLCQNFPVYCNPHSQRRWHSHQSRNRYFSGTLLLFWWSNGCWQFDLWFLSSVQFSRSVVSDSVQPHRWQPTRLLCRPVPCPVLTLASWPAYRFLRRKVRWSGIPISLRIFHSLLWSTQSKALA